MATAIVDGITTRYEVVGSGPPLLMYAPGGFDATLEKWSTQGVYAKIKVMDHLPKRYSCVVFDRRECGQSGGRVERVTWAHYVAQGKGLLDHLDIKRAHLMGGCMGCCPVAAFAVVHPEMVLSMILYWPVGGAKYRISSRQRFAEIGPSSSGSFPLPVDETGGLITSADPSRFSAGTLRWPLSIYRVAVPRPAPQQGRPWGPPGPQGVHTLGATHLSRRSPTFRAKATGSSGNSMASKYIAVDAWPVD